MRKRASAWLHGREYSMSCPQFSRQARRQLAGNLCHRRNGWARLHLSRVTGAGCLQLERSLWLTSRKQAACRLWASGVADSLSGSDRCISCLHFRSLMVQRLPFVIAQNRRFAYWSREVYRKSFRGRSTDPKNGAERQQFDYRGCAKISGSRHFLQPPTICHIGQPDK